jgi:cytidyltransferase-like protein
MKKIVLCTGGYDPIHSGHIAYFKAARALGDMLIVGLNSDEWLERKKGRAFMPWNERLCIVNNLQMVDEVFTFDDEDGSAKSFIRQVRAHYPDAHLIFANGGDRTSNNIPEMDIVDSNLTFEFGVGGEDKKNSSSWILKEWSQPTVERAWGRYTVLDKGLGWQVKQLEFDPGKALSDQRHFKRSEHWHVVEGEITIKIQHKNDDNIYEVPVPAGYSADIPVGTWHKAVNTGNTTARVVEVWLGTELSEADIERRD